MTNTFQLWATHNLLQSSFFLRIQFFPKSDCSLGEYTPCCIHQRLFSTIAVHRCSLYSLQREAHF